MISVLNQDLDHTLAGLTSQEREKLSGATILITGCGGFLGYYFMNFFLAKAKELHLKKIIALDNFMLGFPSWIKKMEEEPIFDIQKFNVISDKIENIKGAENVDFVIHMASIASPMFYRQFPIETLDANIWGLRSLLDFYKDKAIKGFLFYSSSEIYGNPDTAHVPTPEDYYGYVCITGPRACYDESKRFGETMCMLFAQKYNMPIGVARPFNNYGIGMKINDRRVPADFALAIKEGRDIQILSNGSPTRTFCYISDSINGYLKILLHGSYDYFNIGIEFPEISISQLAKIYVEAGREIFDYKGKIVYTTSNDKEYLTNNPQRRCPDINKARRILNYSPSISVEEGVRRFLQFIKESEEGEYKW